MKGVCANHRTPVFLWDFCFQEYIRQYDDDVTIINAGKQNYAGGPELIFLGFYNPDDAIYYQVNTPNERKQHRLYKKNPFGQKETIEEDTSYLYQIKNPGPFIRSYGRLVRYQGNRMFSEYKEYVLVVKIPSNLIAIKDPVLNLEGKTASQLLTLGKLEEYSEQINGQKYYRLERLIDVNIDGHYFLLRENLPVGITSQYVDIKEIVITFRR